MITKPLHYLSTIHSLNTAWKDSHQDPDAFFEKHSHKFKNVSIGCSLSVEQLKDRAKHTSTPLPTSKQVCDFLKQMGMTHVRFGLQWRHVQNGDKLSLDYYRNYLDELIKNDMQICLNVGPIKTMRWPEHQVPQALLDKMATGSQFQTSCNSSEIPFCERSGLARRARRRSEQKRYRAERNTITSIPEIGSDIRPEDELGQYALEYLNTLLNKLKKEYGEKLRMTTWQPDNEPFDQAGPTNWRMHERLVAEEIDLIQSHFPTAQFLINSAVVPGYTSSPSLIVAMAFVAHIIKINPSLRKKITIGADYYYHHPYSLRLPFSKTIADTNTVVQLQYPDIFESLHSHAHENGYKTEVAELQCEPWGSGFPLPGNSVNGLQFALLRSLDYLNNQTQSLIRIWGVEILLLNWLYKKDKRIEEQVGLVGRVNGM
jgi:hypothetical protein